MDQGQGLELGITNWGQGLGLVLGLGQCVGYSKVKKLFISFYTLYQFALTLCDVNIVYILVSL